MRVLLVSPDSWLRKDIRNFIQFQREDTPDIEFVDFRDQAPIGRNVQELLQAEIPHYEYIVFWVNPKTEALIGNTKTVVAATLAHLAAIHQRYGEQYTDRFLFLVEPHESIANTAALPGVDFWGSAKVFINEDSLVQWLRYARFFWKPTQSANS